MDNVKPTTENSKHKQTTRFAIQLFSITLVFVLGLALGLVFQNLQVQSSKEAESVAPAVRGDFYDSGYLSQVFNMLEANYLGDIPSKNQLTEGMARGLVEALDDQYSAYLNPAEAEQYLQQADSAYEGIGVQLGYDGQYTTVVTPMEGQPGIEAGLEAGDVILEVDGEDMSGVRPELTATKIRGEAGSVVALTVYREQEAQVFDFEITRSVIDLDNISYTELENGVVVIDIFKFTEGSEGLSTGAQVFNRNWDSIVEEVKALEPEGIVLDVRNNPGGFVESVRYVADEFLSKGTVILREKEKNQSEKVYTAEREGAFEDIPLNIIVNEGSASSSEILAAAIQDNQRGKVVGKQTVGKGVEQRLMSLEDEALLMVVFRVWLTPDGVQISEEQPITPDIEVDFELNDDSDYDSQLQKALEELN